MATDTLSPADSATQAPAGHLHGHEVLRQIARIAPGQLLKMAITLLVIVFLTQFLLIMAERGRNGLPAAPEVAEQLLATAGSSLADLDRQIEDLGAGETATTNSGAAVHLKISAQMNDADLCYNVTGFIPGTAAKTTTGVTQALDSQVILISAYYDGLGAGPDGTLYPAANDNASGVAAMLEMARVLKESP